MLSFKLTKEIYVIFLNIRLGSIKINKFINKKTICYYFFTLNYFLCLGFEIRSESVETRNVGDEKCNDVILTKEKFMTSFVQNK